MRPISFFRRALAPLAAAAALGVPCRATWSIVAVDTATGEVCVASATCISNFPLRPVLAVVVVGKGGAAAQSAIDTSGVNRRLIWDGLHAGRSPLRILHDLADSDTLHRSRQYGIVDMSNEPVTFTGRGAGRAKAGLERIVGTLRYSIQGNVLAGVAPVWAAETAMLTTEGDLATKVMAGMEAARAFGGDGRCSCSPSRPDSCGSPPPDFRKADHTAFLVVARVGDTDGVCDGTSGCANGDYYLTLDNWGPGSAPDPVLILRRELLAWRETMRGIPDHMLTTVAPGATRLVADGVTSTRVDVRLFDLEGDPVAHGGQTLEITPLGEGPPVALPGPVTDNGDGTHSFEMTATTDAGSGRWRIVVTQGAERVTLAPDLFLEVDPIADLHVGLDVVHALESARIPFVLNLGAREAGRGYLLLGSGSGTDPGTPFGGIVIPLNRDRLFDFTLDRGGSFVLPGSDGTADAGGRAEAAFHPRAGMLAPFIGGRLDFCALLDGPAYAVTGVVGVEVAP